MEEEKYFSLAAGISFNLFLFLHFNLFFEFFLGKPSVTRFTYVSFKRMNDDGHFSAVNFRRQALQKITACREIPTKALDTTWPLSSRGYLTIGILWTSGIFIPTSAVTFAWVSWHQNTPLQGSTKTCVQNFLYIMHGRRLIGVSWSLMGFRKKAPRQ